MHPKTWKSYSTGRKIAHTIVRGALVTPVAIGSVYAAEVLGGCPDLSNAPWQGIELASIVTVTYGLVDTYKSRKLSSIQS